MKKDMDKIHDMMEEAFDSYLFVGRVKGEGGCVAIHDSEQDSLSLLKMLWNGVYEGILQNNDGNKELADDLMSVVYLSGEDLKRKMMERIHEMLSKSFNESDEDEEEDDDADDESEDDHVATPEEVAEFIRNLRPSDLKKYETVGKALEDLQNALSTVGLSFSGNLRIDHADGSDDRG